MHHSVLCVHEGMNCKIFGDVKMKGKIWKLFKDEVTLI